jgi:hypothetical protein
MVIHTDIKAINSPTILLMLIMSFLLFSQPIAAKQINLLVIFFAFIMEMIWALEELVLLNS